MEDNIEEPGVIVGEELLGKQYTISGQEAMRVIKFQGLIINRI